MGTTGSTTPGLSMSRRRMYPDENTSYIRLGCPKLIRGVMEDWKYYPQCCFPDWTPDEVHWGGLFHGCEHMELCTVHEVVILDDGGSKQYSITHVDGDEKLTAACWNWLQEPQPARARVLFVENMSSQVLQMLGTKYNVDPSFFLSSMNWVLSRCYQEDPKPKESDHVTVILPFIRTTRNQQPIERASPIDIPSDGQQKIIQGMSPPYGMTLLQDLLAIHMVRTPTTSTIISYHPRSNLHGTCAKHLQSFLQHSDNSLILSISEDPTAAFILIMKYVLQEWDEAIGILYNCMIELESDAIGNVSVKVLQELHHLQAHVLCYRALLEHFRKSVAFVRELTPNPLTGARPISDRERRFSADLTKSELANLLSNITRLEEQISMFSDQTQRVRLLFAKLLKVIFPCFLAAVSLSPWPIFTNLTIVQRVFCMNVREIDPRTIGTLAQYAGTTIALILGTGWLVVVLNPLSSFHLGRHYIMQRLMWPIFYVYNTISRTIWMIRWSRRRNSNTWMG
ncbi:hypothetical protein EV363DRAFT_1399694 [Boletus edulis]|nr:hypothetical protein EV363DRAFT_1399694 [Boletus edulis]